MVETDRPVCDVRIAAKGPRFFRGEDGEVRFEIQLDSRCKIGPRPMLEADAQQYPQAWEAFAAAEAAAGEPLKQVMAVVDNPAAKTDAEAQKAERQRRMDAKRGGGLPCPS